MKLFTLVSLLASASIARVVVTIQDQDGSDHGLAHLNSPTLYRYNPPFKCPDKSRLGFSDSPKPMCCLRIAPPIFPPIGLNCVEAPSSDGGWYDCEGQTFDPDEDQKIPRDADYCCQDLQSGSNTGTGCDQPIFRPSDDAHSGL